MSIREFRFDEDADYRALAAMRAEVYPEYPLSEAEMRGDDATWDDSRYFRWRAILGDVGWVQVNHARWAFVPDTYRLELGVVPAERRRGHGSALFDAALGILRVRDARRIRATAKESMADGVAFLIRRGFFETKRDWESRLPVRTFDFTPFAGARERVEELGIRITTLRDEMARDPEALRKVYELAAACQMDVPSVDPPTPVDLDTWRRLVLEGPGALPEAYFLAVSHDGRYLGLSDLERSDDPSFFWHGFTGVRRDARGRGIAMALKLETVRYAHDRGVDHIKTGNDQRNRPMLRINEALGFVKQPAWIAYQKDLQP